MIEQACAASDDQLRVRHHFEQSKKRLKQPQRILARLDTAHGEEYWAAEPNTMTPAHAHVGSIGPGRVPLHVHAVGNLQCGDSVIVREDVTPLAADAQHPGGGHDAALLPRRKARILKCVEVMYGTQESPDQPALVQSR